ncbi:MAG: NrtA/SsuA/CpmA family ABC transporter substrate-binding protein [Pseudomonadota bacterium]|nr:NrtA/SsuA/CpmA family ABC transporter substrate-binding protein [Pseudomonadota bacterium]
MQVRAPILSSLTRRRALIGAGAATLLASLYALTRRSIAPEEWKSNVRIAVPLVPHAGLIHIASARGFFRDQGLGVTLRPQSFGKAAVAELLRGQADLAVAADVPVVVEILKGAPLSIVASVANASNELAVLGRIDRGIRTPGDLRGRRVGVTLGTSGEYFLWAFLVRHRIAPQSLQLVDLPPSQLIDSLRHDVVDAIAAWQPVRHEAELAFGDLVVSLHAPDAYAQNYVLVGKQDYVRAHQQELRHVVRALLDAEAFVDANSESAKKTLAGLLKLSPGTFDPSWQDVTLEVEQQQAQLVTLEDVATWAMARNYAPSQPMPNFVSNLALDTLLAVSPERVTVVR